jgi:uncharacterized protein
VLTLSRPALLESSQIVESLKHFFNRKRDILIAFLFGSFATQCVSRSSDVDIGVFFKTAPDRNTINHVVEKLSSILQREIDLVILNQASPVLKMQILKNGILLHAPKRKHFYQFFTDTVNQYDDLKQIRKLCEENILKGRIYAG